MKTTIENPDIGDVVKHPAYSARFIEALSYTAQLHARQFRRTTTIPYMGHLMAVATTVLENGGNEDEAIAGLLHDAVEDQGGYPTLREIRRRFGDTVADIVEHCSDSFVDERVQQKGPPRERREKYIQALRESSNISVYLVSAADKLHNARSTAWDYAREGEDVWKRFNPLVGREGTLWYYRELIAVYEAGAPDPRRAPIMQELKSIIDAIEGLSAPVRPGQYHGSFRFVNSGSV